MKANDIVADARVMQVRELKTALADAKARLAKAESERDAIVAHCALGVSAIRDFERLGGDGELRIVDGWNAILREKNVSKLSAEAVSGLKGEYLAALGIVAPAGGDAPPADGPMRTWIVFDGSVANSYRSGPYRVTYTGGVGAHRADRMIVDFINAARLLGLDVSRIVVETADKDLRRRAAAAGARLAPDPRCKTAGCGHQCLPDAPACEGF